MENYPNMVGFLIFETFCLSEKISQKFTAFVFGNTNYSFIKLLQIGRSVEMKSKHM